MVENRHQKTLRELFEEAYGKKDDEHDGIYLCDEEEDDDDADCFCD